LYRRIPLEFYGDLTMFNEEYIYESLLSYLQPWENAFLDFQLIMLWYSPRKSLIFIGIIELLLIYICFTKTSWLFLLFFIIWLLFVADFVRNHIWSSSQTTPDFSHHPPMSHVISVEDLAKKLARFIVWFQEKLQLMQQFRQTNRNLFYSTAIFVLLNSAYLGTRVSGKVMFFLIVNVFIWIPCAVVRFGVISRVWEMCEPLWQYVEGEFATLQVTQPISVSTPSPGVPEETDVSQDNVKNQPSSSDTLQSSTCDNDIVFRVSEPGINEESLKPSGDEKSSDSSDIDISGYELLEYHP
jgi:hypothetical protein